jgi:hypothetical protein
MKKHLINTKSKIPIFIIMFCFSGFIMAKDFRSKDETTGNWTNNNTWIGDIPALTNLEGNSHIYIQGYVSLSGSLDYSSNGSLTIMAGDTLFVDGNMNTSGTFKVNIYGILIINGNLSLGGSSDVGNNGKVIVIGDVTNSGSSDIVNSGNFYVAGNYEAAKITNTTGAVLGDESLLYASDPTLFNFVNQITNSALPVQLTKFDARLDFGKIILNFSTHSEQNFDYFSIERSADAKNYTVIGKVKGSGWSQEKRNYTFTDNNPLPGLNYYRLKAVDFDGYMEYFPPISIYNDDAIVQVFTMVKDKNLIINSNINASVSLISMGGLKVFTGQITNGVNELTLSASLGKGVYSLIVVNDQNVVKRTKVYIE